MKVKILLLCSTLFIFTLFLLIDKDTKTDGSSEEGGIKPPVTLLEKVQIVQPSRLSSDEIPESLTKLFDDKTSKRERMQAIFGLSNDLSEEEISCLYSFLANDRNDSHYLFVKDEIMVKLEKQLKRPSDYEATLAGIIKNRQIDGDLRGYAVQHLRMAWFAEDVDKEFVEAVLWDSVNDYESDVSGTALLALNEIMTHADRQGELQAVQHEAEKLALDDTSYKTSRLTALSLIMQHGEASDPIKDLAEGILSEDSNYDTAFKLVAKKLVQQH